MKLLRDTRWFRATLETAGRVILDGEPGDYAYRKVTLFVLDSPSIEVAIDCPPESNAGRDAYWPRPPTNKTICVCLRPGQSLSARSIGEIHELSVLVEYWG